MNRILSLINSNLSTYKYKDLNEIIASVNFKNVSNNDINSISEVLLKDSRKNVKALGTRLLNNFNKFLKEKERVTLMYDFDKSFGEYNLIAGVDEVGRGPLAGPIVSCAVILDYSNIDEYILEINDSKKLSEAKREDLANIIKEKAIAYSIALCDNKEIDKKGIGVCNNEVFIKACSGLKLKPELVLSDGYLIKNFNLPNKSVIKGDTKSAAIACASIVAKVYRDRLMKEFHEKYPQYDFIQNVGYGTKKHVDALKKVGPCEIHRMSFLNNILNL